MKHKLQYLLILTLLLLGCKDKVDNKEGYFLVFYPRKATFIWATPGVRIGQEYEGTTYYDYYTIDNNSEISYKNYQ